MSYPEAGINHPVRTVGVINDFQKPSLHTPQSATHPRDIINLAIQSGIGAKIDTQFSEATGKPLQK